MTFSGMTKYFWVVFLLVMLPIGSWAKMQKGRILDAQEKADILSRIQKVQNDLTTLQGNFREERQIAGLKTPLVFEGRLYLTREGFLLLEYTSPVQHILKIDNNNALFYVKGSKSADRIDLSKISGDTPRPDFFRLDVRQFQGEVREEDGSYRLEDSSRQGKTVTVSLDRETLLAQKIVLSGPGSDFTTIELLRVQMNKPLPREITDFRLPPGTTIHSVNQQ